MRKLALSLAFTLLFAIPSKGATITFEAFMSGPAEDPPNASPGTGVALVTYDDGARTLAIDATWSGLIGTTTVAHIHCCTAAPFTGAVSVAVTPGTLPGFPVGTTAGAYSVVLDLSDPTNYTGGFLALGGGTDEGAEALLIAGLLAGKGYFNIHSTFAGGGEIRGFLVATPEPATMGLMAIGIGAIALLRRRRRR